MNILQKFILLITVLTGSFMVLGISGTAQAALFDGSKDQACRGANLGGGADCDKPAAANTLNNTIEFIVNILTIIVGIVAVIMIIVGGFRYITSSGDSNNINAAKNTIIYAIVGLIVVALAQVIVRFVLSKV